MGRIKKQVIATSLREAKADAKKAWGVGKEIYGQKITKVTVKLATTGRRPYDVVITTAKVKRR